MSFLFRSLLLAFMVLTVPLAAMASAAPPSPELQVLNHYLGDWDGTLTSLPNVKIAISCEWVLDGNFLRH